MRKIKGNIMSFDRKFRTLQSSNVQSGSSVNGTNPPDPGNVVLASLSETHHDVTELTFCV